MAMTPIELANLLDLRDRSVWLEMSDEDIQKCLPPIVMQRWLSAVYDREIDWDEARRQGRKKGDKKGQWPGRDRDQESTDYYVLAVNQIVNPFVFSLYRHPRLLYLLMSTAGVGVNQKHGWLPGSGIDKIPQGVLEVLEHVAPGANSFELEVWSQINGINGFEYLCQDLGMQDNKIKKLLEEFEEWQNS